MASPVNNGIFGLDPLYQSLIDNIITLESTKKFTYQDEVTEQEARKSAISTVGSALSSFDSLLTEYASSSSNFFDLYAAASSNEDAFTVTNTSQLTSSGSYDLEIQQIARQDVRVSAQFTAAGNTLASAVTASTGDDELSFDITVNGNTSTITIDALTGLSNEDVLSNIASAINSAAGEDVQASILREDANSVRLSVRSRESGQDNAITFSNTIDIDGLTNIAEALEFTVDLGNPTADDNNGVIASGSTNGGRLYALSSLDAEFTIDGLQFTRSSNSVTDAITGLNLTLNQVTTGVEKLTISSDIDGGVENVNDFIDSYNNVISEIRAQSFLNGVSGDRGPLYKDRAFRELTIDLRQQAISTSLSADVIVTPPNLPTGVDIQTILDIGIDVNTDGTLSIDDESRLREVLESNPNDVKTLFTNDRTDAYKGIAEKLRDSIEVFVETDGLVFSLTTSIDDNIRSLNERIDAQDELLARRRTQLTDEYIQLQALIDESNSQFQSIQAFGNQLGF